MQARAIGAKNAVRKDASTRRQRRRFAGPRHQRAALAANGWQGRLRDRKDETMQFDKRRVQRVSGLACGRPADAFPDFRAILRQPQNEVHLCSSF